MGLFDYLGLGGNAQNVLTGGATDQPDWSPAQIDAGTAAVIQQMADEGRLSEQDLVNQQLAGTSPTMAPATGGAVAQQQATLGGDSADNAAVNQALNERANRLYASQYNQLQHEAEASAPGERGRLMSQGANALEQQQAINDELNRQQMAVTQQKWGLRNQIIGQLMSGAGSFAGGYAGNKAGQKRAQNTHTDMSGAWAGPDQPSGAGSGMGYSSNGLG